MPSQSKMLKLTLAGGLLFAQGKVGFLVRNTVTNPDDFVEPESHFDPGFLLDQKLALDLIIQDPELWEASDSLVALVRTIVELKKGNDAELPSASVVTLVKMIVDLKEGNDAKQKMIDELLEEDDTLIHSWRRTMEMNRKLLECIKQLNGSAETDGEVEEDLDEKSKNMV